MKKTIILFALMSMMIKSYSQSYPNNEEGMFEDMLTPEYYNTPLGNSFREEVNKFIHFARIIPFQHPLKNSFGESPSYIIKRNFGNGIGFGGTAQHHNAFDFHIGNKKSNVVMFAAIDGLVRTYYDASKYRNYITISKDVKDSIGNPLGKIVVVYGHVDLELDTLENRRLNEQEISKGDTISKNLYLGTKGGPHLHFEIRYYRNSDIGIEAYYNWKNSHPFTEPSSGKWSYGYWNPEIGYGFAHPDNHLNKLTTSIPQVQSNPKVKIYPNPAQNCLTIERESASNSIAEIYNIQGQLIQVLIIEGKHFELDISDFNKGLYMIKIGENIFKFTKE